MLLTDILTQDPSLREIVFAVVVFIWRMIEKSYMKRKFENDYQGLIEQNERQAQLIKELYEAGNASLRKT